MSETICYFKSGIGNLILATPAFQALASMDPSGMVDVCLSNEYAKDSRCVPVTDILRASPYVDQIIEWPNGRHRKHFIPVQSEGSKVGKEIQRSTQFNRTRWPGANWVREKIHEIEANMRIVRAMGYRGKVPKPHVPVAGGPVLDLPRPRFAVCNSSFGSSIWQKKRWPHFSWLIEELKSKYGGSVFGVGGGGDLLGIEGIDLDLSGKTSITETAKALTQADLFVTSDTGCMHVASYLDVATVGIFGGTLTTKNAPLGSRSVALRSTLFCAPCQYVARFHKCVNATCMERIYPKDVMSAATEAGLLKEAGDGVSG